ncbi:hypothetical protein N7G274_008166 [Stereocaulon virgatum]|uniref:Mitochondrial cytochrome c oxidase assembly factor n=1 Tax=Stereocaulon virgatum TaxID=373712 RepID=A0ABR3ZZK2_9LECA
MASRTLSRLFRSARSSPFRLPPTLATHESGGSNLEVFKFGMYIMFPIGWMWYFGTNLDTRFSVPDFWPAPETTHKIPFEKEELKQMGERLKAERLERRRKRLEQARLEMREGDTDEMRQPEQIEQTGQANNVTISTGTFGRGAIERWARGKS